MLATRDIVVQGAADPADLGLDAGALTLAFSSLSCTIRGCRVAIKRAQLGFLARQIVGLLAQRRNIGELVTSPTDSRPADEPRMSRTSRSFACFSARSARATNELTIEIRQLLIVERPATGLDNVVLQP